MNRIDEFNKMMTYCIGDDRRFSSDFVDWLTAQGFFIKPAAISHHGNYAGGLFGHSFMVANVLMDMTKKLDLHWKDGRSPLIVGMFHDICKLDEYVDENASDVVVMGTGSPVSKNPKWAYNKESVLGSGHGEKSILMLSQWMTLTEEEMLCIRYHMGAYKTDDWTGYDLAIRKYETVLWTHTADMYASKVQDV